MSAFLDRVFSPLIGKPCWQAKAGHGSFFTLEFGQPHLEIREPKPLSQAIPMALQSHVIRRVVTVRGQWHLWIYCCDWQICAGARLMGVSSDDREMRRGIAYLDGQAFQELRVDVEQGRSTFVFDLGGEIRTSPYDDSEQWMLYEPSGRVLSYRADGKFCYGPKDAALEAASWRSLEELSGGRGA